MGGLIIDGSTPAAHSAGINTPANTCASFTPPSDPLILATWAGDSFPGTSPATPLAASSPSQTWVVDQWDNEQTGSPVVSGQAAIAHTVVTGSPGATTVTITNGETTAGSRGSLLQVYVITGHDPVTPIGVTGGGRLQDSSSISDSYIASISGGQGFMVICDWAAQDTSSMVPNSGCTIEDKGTVAGEVSYAVVRRTDPDGILGVTTSLGVWGLPASGGRYHWVYAEIISLEAAIAAATSAGYPARGANAPMF